MALIKPSKKADIFHSIEPEKVEYKGGDLVDVRNETGLTQTQFGKLCGWTAQNQYKLERPGKHKVFIETANKIIGAVSGQDNT